MNAEPSPSETEADITNLIPQHDAITRRENLRDITKLGLKHIEDKKVRTTALRHEIVSRDAVVNVIRAVKQAEDYVKDAAKDLPYAPIILAGIALVLPF